jgi:AcrR family transcriptional regulator
MDDSTGSRAKATAGGRRYHHGDLRRALLETAEAMLREDPSWQFTLREVARRAGVSHTAPYNHFDDKAALLAELALMGFDRLREACLAAMPGPGAELRAEYLAVARAYVSFGVENPGLYRLMFSQEAGAAVHENPRSRAAFGVMLEMLERGQREGLLRKRRVRSQAAACWAEVHGITMLTMDGLFRRETVGRKALDEALETLLEGLEP